MGKRRFAGGGRPRGSLDHGREKQAHAKAGENLTQITLNDVVRSVAAALTARFPELPVYTERGSEGLPAPSLFVQLSKSEQTRELNRRFKRTYSLDVPIRSYSRITEQY
ncbi:phage tail terminator family protein [Paenibacillus macerans]|uniref:phage tail terminator family protein n=1 Tax=Paenibacillus macerans TaxID=44252 RepID=UPI003D319DFB